MGNTHSQWKDQARIAVQFVINYEEGGESPKIKDLILAINFSRIYRMPLMCCTKKSPVIGTNITNQALNHKISVLRMKSIFPQ